jgi:tetrahydromethanopterin S-methyltransferase subunit D
MSHTFHKFWLIITAIVVGSFGPVFFLGTMPATAEPARWTLDLLSWPLDGAQSYDFPTLRFLSALTGGFLLGWGVMIWCLRAWVYDIAPEAVRRVVLTSVLAWFVLDSAGSIASGNASNALFNIVVLLLAVGPLWRPAKA